MPGKGRMMEPTGGVVSQVFGANPQFSWQAGYGHLGMDWAVPIGTPVCAIADGTVLWADWGQKMPAHFCTENMFVIGSPASGIAVVVQHDGWRALYAHLSETHLNSATAFRKADVVRRGDVVGKSGNTGNSTGPHLHYESYLAPSPSVPKFGRYNPADQIALEDRVAAALQLAQNQRRVGPANYLRRKEARRDSPEVELVKANTVETFTGYVIGEDVDLGGIRSNVWYADAAGYLWAGACTTQTVTGLPNLTPVPAPSPVAPTPLAPNQRVVGKSGARQRPEPRLGKIVVREIPGGTVENFTHWTVGESVTSGNVTSDLWYKDSIGFVWAGGFETQTRDGLVEYKAPEVVVPPVVVVVPKPETAPPRPALVAELASVTEVHQAASNKYNAGNKAWPILDVYVHQFSTATPEEDAAVNRFTVRLDSLINTFTNPEAREASCHIGIDGKRVAQFVSLRDRAWHGGSVGNDGIGIEVYGAFDAESLASLNRVLVELSKLAGGTLRLHRHNEVMATACGRHVPLEQIAATLAASLAGATPAPAPAPSPAPGYKVTDADLRTVVAELTAAVDTYLTERK